MKKIIVRMIFIIFIILLILSILKKQPEGVNFESKDFVDTEVKFLRDLTYLKDNKRIVNQEIFDNVFKLIDESEDFIIVDMFLFNDNYANNDDFENLSKILSEKLIKKKKEKTNIKIIFITDPINTFYGSYDNPYIEKMKKEKIDIVMTDLDKLANSNPLFSVFWDIGLKELHTKKSSGGWITNPFGDPENKVHLLSLLKMLNFKANHRKTLITEKAGVILSSNPHGASYYHSNIGFLFKGKLLKDLLDSELNVIKFSDEDLYAKTGNLKIESTIEKSNIKGKIITEEKIKINLLKYIDSLKKDDELKITMFYLSEFDIIKAIKEADKKGADIQIILDPNKDAFGIKKLGIPNVSVAKYLIKNSNIKVKWYDTNGEQFHSKMVILNYKKESVVIGGSANLTRRNLNNYNLETNIIIKADKENDFIAEVNDYFDKIYSNKDAHYVSKYSKYKNDSVIKQIIYFVQEFSGLGTF